MCGRTWKSLGMLNTRHPKDELVKRENHVRWETMVDNGMDAMIVKKIMHFSHNNRTQHQNLVYIVKVRASQLFVFCKFLVTLYSNFWWLFRVIKLIVSLNQAPQTEIFQLGSGVLKNQVKNNHGRVYTMNKRRVK
jgi:hypothetical protein